MQPEPSCSCPRQEMAPLNPEGLCCPLSTTQTKSKGRGSEDKPGGEMKQVWSQVWLGSLPSPTLFLALGEDVLKELVHRPGNRC